MADRKISDLTALTATASGDYLPIVDISEGAAASKNKRVTIQSLFQGIPVNVGIGTSSPGYALHVNTSTAADVELAVQNSAGLARYGTRTSGNAFAGSFTAGKSFELWSASAQAVTIDSSGRVGIGTTSPTTLLDVNADTVRVRTARTPASASATGATGEICWDANYIYVCTATNTWKRTAIATW